MEHRGYTDNGSLPSDQYVVLDRYSNLGVTSYPPETVGEAIGLQLSDIVRNDPTNIKLLGKVASYNFYYNRSMIGDFFNRPYEEIQRNYLMRTEILNYESPSNYFISSYLPKFSPNPYQPMSYLFFGNLSIMFPQLCKFNYFLAFIHSKLPLLCKPDFSIKILLNMTNII